MGLRGWTGLGVDEERMGVLGTSQGVLWDRGDRRDLVLMKKGWESLGRPKESYGTEGMDGTWC